MARTRIRPKRSIETSVKSGNFRSTKSGAGMTSKGVKAYRRANPVLNYLQQLLVM